MTTPTDKKPKHGLPATKNELQKVNDHIRNLEEELKDRNTRNRRSSLSRDDMLDGEDWQQQQQLDRHEKEIAELKNQIAHWKAIAHDLDVRVASLENAPPVSTKPSSKPEKVPSWPPNATPRNSNRTIALAGVIALAVLLGAIIIVLGIAFALNDSQPSTVVVKVEHEAPIATQQPVAHEHATNATASTPSAPPGIPDGGIITRNIAARYFEITIGNGINLGEKGRWSDPVYTEQTTATVYTCTTPEGTRLDDNVKILFPNGDRGKANGSGSYNGQWIPEESPLRFQGPVGSVARCTWRA